MLFPWAVLLTIVPDAVRAVGSLFSRKGRETLHPKVKVGVTTSAVVTLVIVALRWLGAPVDDFYPEIQDAVIIVCGFVAAWLKQGPEGPLST